MGKREKQKKEVKQVFTHPKLVQNQVLPFNISHMISIFKALKMINVLADAFTVCLSLGLIILCIISGAVLGGFLRFPETGQVFNF